MKQQLLEEQLDALAADRDRWVVRAQRAETKAREVAQDRDDWKVLAQLRDRTFLGFTNRETWLVSERYGAVVPVGADAQGIEELVDGDLSKYREDNDLLNDLIGDFLGEVNWHELAEVYAEVDGE